ncbi:MAG TPA: DUF4139 domain-containing protein [Flavobacteriales bacterium]|nr:DUF4139 domain-containing protein [Flavobacteriales bacterium]
MKTTSILATLVISFNAMAAGDNVNNIETPSKPFGVTVFLTGAELGHTTEVKLQKGKNEVKFTGLSSKMDQESIVVDIADKNITILSVFFSNNFLAEMQKNPKVKILRDSVERIKDKLAFLEGKKETIIKEKDLLFKKDYEGLDNDIAKLNAYTEYCRKRRDELSADAYKITKTETSLKERLLMFTRQLEELNTRVGMPSAEISVLVLASDDVSAKFDLKYRVADAGWAPKYDIRVDGMDKPVNLYYKANIYNNTGVDWNNVKLKLSTADPLQGAQYPRMEAWDLKQDPTQTESYKNAQKQIKELQEENKTIQFKTIEVDELSAEFEIMQAYTIPSDNRPYLVDVNNKQLQAKYEYVSIPKMDRDAFLVAKVVGWAELSLVSGDASVYYNGSYIGKSKISVQEISDTLELSLGRDNKIAITRIKKSELNDHQIIGNNEKEVFKYEIVVKNNRETPININVTDQVPLKNDSRIDISISEISDGKYDKYSGDVTWALALQPGETKKITFNFSSKYPKEFDEYYRAKSQFYQQNYNYGIKRKFRTLSAPSF